MIIDFTIEDLILNSYLQKNFHTLRQSTREVSLINLDNAAPLLKKIQCLKVITSSIIQKYLIKRRDEFVDTDE